MAACIDVAVRSSRRVGTRDPKGEANGKNGMWPAARPGPRAARRRVTQ